MKQLLVLPAFLTLTACGPVPLVQAEAECRSRADQAAAPSGSVGVTSDFLKGRDPTEVYNQCVLARAGQPPLRPYNALPPLR